MSKKNDTVESAAIENEGAQTAENVNSGFPAVENEKSYQIITANSREELDKAISDLKAQQPEGVSLISGPIAKDAFGQYVIRIEFVK
jgi:hypothetical protein